MADSCKYGGATRDNGNCTTPGPDGAPVQCVGPWAEYKHDYLRRYIEATAAARQKFLDPKGPGRAGGAAYVDLFAGPGLARVRTTGAIVDGSPLIAGRHTGAPFTKLIFADLDGDNVVALRARLTNLGRPAETVVEGDCNERIDEVVRAVPAHGLNLALLDPYGLRPLHFETIGTLAAVKRMDIVIHFPMMDIKRNFNRPGTDAFITRFLGTDSWKTRVTRPQDAAVLIDIFREQLGSFGYTQDTVRSLPISDGGPVLYYLVFATKKDLGNKIWNSIARTDPKGGQKSFPFS